MRSLRRNTRGLLAMEEEQRRREEEAERVAAAEGGEGEGEGEVQAELTPEQEIGDNANTLETDLLEAAETEDDAVEEVEAVEEAGEAVEALESLREVLKVSLESSGMDRHGAAALGIALESQYKRIGYTPATKLMPALEDFGGASSRVKSTKLALEEVNAAIAKVWETIKKAWARVAEFFANLWEKYTNAAVKLGERAKALAGKAKEAKGAPSESSIDKEPLTKALAIGTSVPGGAKGAEVLESFVKKLFPTISGHASDLEKAVEELGKGEGDAAAASEKALATLKQVLGSAGKGPVLPGNVAVVIEDGEPALDEVGEGSGKVPVLKSNEAEEVAAAVEAIAGVLVAAKGDLKKLEDFAGKIAKSSSDKAEDVEGKVQDYIKLSKLANQPYAAVARHALMTGKALLDQVEESLKLHKAEGAGA